ncbi:hypothetical protein ISF_07836 [Cordyceps fumosorosea ARSEF 2679]|uniref:Ribosome biogenesis protein SLX9 n=1 Tax=Cordyceps fumosorosea (strain ARSEF 2679) TaxID=1081104 RepID=A0A167NMW4_CORFA|nr:hypothetical protein ISF_07836 [Cordyceps fumosorosea ARSEF 2679]OAA55731.1 hypothetical protein ISF_07836 [Cordyceps fumosorosea ARSEF 2679]
MATSTTPADAVVAESRPPFPPFTLETAKIKVKAAQDAWNTKYCQPSFSLTKLEANHVPSRQPDVVKMAYTPDTVWRNRDQFLQGRDAVRDFLAAKWSRESGYRLRKELFAFTDDRIAVQFWYEWYDEEGRWWRTYGLEDWTFAADGLMRKRQMSGNDVEISEEERWFKDGVDVNAVEISERHCNPTIRYQLCDPPKKFLISDDTFAKHQQPPLSISPSAATFSTTNQPTIMAPLPPGLRKPSARTFRQQRVSGAVHPLAPPKTFRADAVPVSDDFSSTKRDKRLMKHSTFLSRVAASSSGVSKKKRTGRGRSKKLATTLESLADALPELEEGGSGQLGKVRHSSIKSKKGALKRKERVVKGEMERFGASMAQLASTQQQVNAATATTGGDQKTGGGDAPQTSNRWAALRGYISSTMEQNPAFVGRS